MSLSNVELVQVLTIGSVNYTDPKLEGHLRVNTLFVSENVRAAVNEGRADFTPCRLGEIPLLFSSGVLPLDVALIHVTPPDEHGFCSFGVEVGVTKAAAQAAKLVIAELNPNMPQDPRRLLHPHQPDPQDRPGRLPAHRGQARKGQRADDAHRQARRLDDRGRLDDADGDRRDPRRGPELSPRQEGPRRPHRALLRRRRRPLRAGRHHGGEEDDPPREDDRGLPDRLARGSTTSSTTTRSSSSTRPSTSTTRTSSGRTTGRSRSTRPSRST